MATINYDIAPPQQIFDEIKRESIKIWETYDNTYGYATEKISQIEPLTNIRDNYSFIVGMFDGMNQQKLLYRLSAEGYLWLAERLYNRGFDV